MDLGIDLVFEMIENQRAEIGQGKQNENIGKEQTCHGIVRHIPCDNRQRKCPPGKRYEPDEVERVVAHMYAEDVDDIEIWYRQQQKQKMVAEEMPAVGRIKQPDEEVKDKEYTHPELESHIAVAFEKVYFFESVDRDKNNQENRQNEHTKIQQCKEDPADAARRFTAGILC